MVLELNFGTDIVTYGERQEEVLQNILSIKSTSGIDESVEYEGRFAFAN